MAFLIIPRGWEIPGREATSEAAWRDRRSFLKTLGLMGLGLATGSLPGCGPSGEAVTRGAQEKPAASDLYPVPRNPIFTLDRPLTGEIHAASYNNFYEFTTRKGSVWKKVAKFRTHPWQVEIAGLVEKPGVFDIDELVRLAPLEERLYRFRCVEAWAMAVPWTGFPMRALVEKVRPLSAARYARFVSFLRPEEAPNQHPSYGPWPYTEGLTMAEVTNELTLLGTGIYGHPLPKQHGAPIRLIVPWKYGFKSIKSIVRIEFTERQPATLWNTIAPHEYDFWANVNPGVAHPRWSQATERMIGSGERRPTILYNGYGPWVARLYARS